MKLLGRIIGAVVVIGLVAAGVVCWRVVQLRAKPKRDAIVTLNRLETALRTSDENALLEVLVVPAAIRESSPSEQNEFLRKALVDEVSTEGVRVLSKEGLFGPLSVVFPNEAASWASAAGVDASSCVAFRLEKNGVVAEVAIATNGVPRVIRCNNVKQMAL